jgi:hypothetical protein
MLYSYNGGYPQVLPNRIRLSNGFTRTDRTSYTPEEIADAGYIQVADQPSVTYPNRLFWNGTDWIIREPNEVEIENQWSSIKKECQRLLTETDYKVIKSYELGIPLSQSWIDYRQSIRDIYNNVNNIDPWNVVWAAAPVN